MLKKYICTVLALLALPLITFSISTADDAAPMCLRLDEKATGDMARYSLHGEANGPIFFSGIRCAMELRSRELCAMEMISFDTTSKVYDFYSGEEIELSKAYFWLNEENRETPIVAFKSKESAEKYKLETAAGEILDYTALTDRKFN